MKRILLSLLVLLCLLPVPSLGKSIDICAAQANYVYQWTELRNQGIPKGQILGMFDFTKGTESPYHDQVVSEIKEAVNFIYKDAPGSPADAGNEWFDRCLQTPDYVEEKTL